MSDGNTVSCNLWPVSIVIGIIVYLITHSVLWAIAVSAFWWLPIVTALVALALVLKAIAALLDGSTTRKRRSAQNGRMRRER